MCKLIILLMMRLLILSNFATASLLKNKKNYSKGSYVIGNIWMKSIEEYLNDDFAMSYADGSLSVVVFSEYSPERVAVLQQLPSASPWLFSVWILSLRYDALFHGLLPFFAHNNWFKG